MKTSRLPLTTDTALQLEARSFALLSHLIGAIVQRRADWLKYLLELNCSNTIELRT
jgi:hypothetical protein